jgi:hypothetical protein
MLAMMAMSAMLAMLAAVRDSARHLRDRSLCENSIIVILRKAEGEAQDLKTAGLRDCGPEPMWDGIASFHNLTSPLDAF